MVAFWKKRKDRTGLPTAQVRLREHGELIAPRPGLELTQVSMTPTGEPVALWMTPADSAAAHGRGSDGMFPDTRTRRPVTGMVTAGDLVVELPEHEIAFPSVQTLSGGRVLIVGCRARWTAESGEHNALLISPDGEVLRSACLGDGIAHVYTDDTDDIWVGYFDEGVYGNYGWHCAEPEKYPIGSTGLVRFDDALRQVWQWPFEELAATPEFAATDPRINDCYALNVGGDATWMSYYSGFPLVRIQSDESITVAAQFETGIRTVVGGDDLAVGIGGYEHPDLVRPISLTGGPSGELALLTAPDGSALTHQADPVRRHARGSDLHVFAGTRWLRTDIDALDDYR